MKRAWWVVPAAALLLAGCDMRSPAQKKKEAEEARRKAAANAGPVVRPEPPEDGHVLVKAASGGGAVVQRPSVVLVRVGRDGVIECSKLNFVMGDLKSTEKGGASASSGCCTATDPPEVRAMGGVFDMLRGSTFTATSPPCEEPVMLDGDYKAPWLQVRKVLETMAKANMTRLFFATSNKPQGLSGIPAKLPANWNAAEAIPANAKRVDVAAKGKELQITVNGTVHTDVASAVSALQKAGITEIGIHPMDARTPLWAVVKGVEVSNSIAPAGPVRFVMVDR
ncbi:MAG: hypothetical protein FD180_2856 [Planctomycetota bacterium]|nr:MAG: hypothetical protein FD180_2856 [Planctomycetota bacterium]